MFISAKKTRRVTDQQTDKYLKDDKFRLVKCIWPYV